MTGSWLAVVAAVLSYTGAHWVARRAAVIDEPGGRRLHRRPTPRGGGFAMAWLVVIGLAGGALTAPPTLAPWLAGFTFAAAMVVLGGQIEDWRGLAWPWRLALQALAGGVVALAWIALGGGLLAASALALALVAMVNAANFVDGADAFLATQVLVATLLAVLIADQLGYFRLIAVPAWIVIGGVLGFVALNLPPARVFMGDAGAYALGFWIASLMFGLLALGAWPLALLLMPAPLIDAALTLGSRVLRNRRWYSAHREHLYQWWIRRGASHGQVTAAYLAFQALIAVPALMFELDSIAIQGVPNGVAALMTLALGSGLWIWQKRQLARRRRR